MLRPANSILGSSRAARRRNVRAERVRALGLAARGFNGLVRDVFGSTLDLALLALAPVAYLAAAYLVLDLPLGWLSGHAQVTLVGVIELVTAAVISLIGVARALRDEPPVCPVRPAFARAMLALGWAAALLLTVADLY